MKKILFLCLVLSLSFACFACGNDTTADVSKIPVQSNYSNITDEDIQSASQGNNSGVTETLQSNTATDNTSRHNTGNNTSVNNLTSQNTTSAVNSKTSGTTTSAVDDTPNKKDLNIFIPRNYTKQEQALIDSYQKTYGIKINTTVVTNDYYGQMLSLISGGNSPDLVLFDSDKFPLVPTATLQPINDYLSNTSGNLNQKHMDAFKVGDKIYGFAKGANWFNDAKNYVIYYNAKLFKDAGITTPYQLYKEGNWNWQTQRESLVKLKNANKSYKIGFQTPDLMMLSAGVDFISYDSKTGNYVCNTLNLANDSLIVKAWQEMASLKQDGFLYNSVSSVKDFNDGSIAVFGATAEGMCCDFGWFKDFKDGVNNIEAVPFAGPVGKTSYTPLRADCFGIPKKAKNPDDAIAFLNYFLDTSNYNMNKDFYHTQFKNVFEAINKNNSYKKIAYTVGAIDATSAITSGKYSQLCDTLIKINYGNNPATAINNYCTSTFKQAVGNCNKRVSIFMD